MKYVLDSAASTVDRLVLRRSRRINHVMLAVSLGLGLPMIAGAIVYFFSTESGHPAPPMLLGLGVFVAALCQLVSLQFRAPRGLIFDNARGYLLIDETGQEHSHAAIVPYSSIEGFRWLPHTALSGAGHGSNRAVVEMTKRNGAVWTLSMLPTAGQAESLADTLRERVELSRPMGRPSHPHEPRLIRVDQEEGTTVLRWKRRYSIVQSALLLLAMVGFTVSVAGARPLISTALHHGGLGFCFVLAALALYALVVATFNSRRVEVTSDMLRANCGVGGVGQVQMPLDEIDTVVFHFAPSQRDALFVLRQAERERLVALTRGKVSLTDALAANALSAKLVRIEIGDLTMPEKLNLEHLLRRLISQATGRAVH